ncbi:MAG: 1-acyl-sn-glycerol-3-phosphate acyltransferase [Clostridia bacterium]|jgi:1-acyl-sn-glycerol-3-phosphate acyltransferase|nr:1-acyl-sn-glycerol-3-phosphate acyltransferase [Clostridia bacterium]MBT7123344.1 1-acyl-sn-glycerol-3-phosphate acyltransferase [Clostridia bacterium]
MFYYFVKYLLTPFLYIFFFPKIIGRKNTKIKGKAIIISNHSSMGDPLLLSATFHRQILWMSKAELFEHKLTAALFNGVRSFPVHRGESDLPAIRHAFRMLRDGEILGIFPEGTRVKSEGIRDFESGTALLALKSKAPIIPVYIKGDYKLFRRMTLTIGEPILLSEHIGEGPKSQTTERATLFLQNKLLEMREALN